MANEKFKINGVVSEVVPIIGTTGDVLKKTVSGVEWGSLDKATQAEAEAGTNDTKIMTPLRVKQVTEQYATKTELANIDLTEELENLATKAELENKVDKVNGKQLSTNDYTTTEKNKLAGIETGAQKNIMTSADKTKLDGIETGAQKNNVTSSDITNWNNKVDKVSGKQLSTNDYTTTEKNKLSGIQAGAQVNAVTSVNGQTGAVTAPNTTYDVATTSANGLMSSADKTKLNGVETGAQKNTITSVQGRTGAVTVSKSDVGLGNVDNIKQMPISGGVLENYTEKFATVGGSLNLSLGNVFQHSPSGNTVYSITNAVNGQAHSFTLIINMGSIVRTLTFPTSVKWQGGEIPDLTTASKTYVLTFMSVNGGTTWLGMFGGEF